MLNVSKSLLLCLIGARLVVFGWISWHWWRLFKQRTAHIFKKRFTDYLLLFSMLFLLYIHIGSNYRIIALFFTDYRDSQANHIISFVLFMITGVPWAWIELLRGWFMWYDLRLSRATTRREWRLFLQDTLDYGGNENSVQSSITHTHNNNHEVSHSEVPSALQRALHEVGVSPKVTNDAQCHNNHNNNDDGFLPEIKPEIKMENSMDSHHQSEEDAHEPTKSGSPIWFRNELDSPISQDDNGDRSSHHSHPHNHNHHHHRHHQDDQQSNQQHHSGYFSFSEDWFILQRRTFGNQRWMNTRLFYLITVHLCFLFILLTGAAIGLYSFILFASVSLGGALIQRGAFLALFYYTPTVDDCIYIRFELKWAAILNAVGLLGLLIPDILRQIFTFSPSTFVTVHVILQDFISGVYLWIVLSLIPQMLCVSGMINAFTDASARAEYSVTHSELSLTPRLARKKTLSSDSGGHKKSRKLIISVVRKLITDNDGFQLFMAHLMHEFSQELLLSVVEFITFKRYIIDTHLSSSSRPSRAAANSIDAQQSSHLMVSPQSEVKGDQVSQSSLVLADSDAGKTDPDLLGHVMQPPIRNSKTKSLDQYGTVTDESLPLPDRVYRNMILVDSSSHGSLFSATESANIAIGSASSSSAVPTAGCCPPSSASASSDSTVVCAESLLVSSDSQHGPGSLVSDNQSTTPTTTTTMTVTSSDTANTTPDGSPAFFASLHSDHSLAMSGIHSPPTSRHSSYLGCPTRLRHIKYRDYRFPKCVKTPGLLKLVQRNRIDLATWSLALFEKYLSDDSSLEVNVSFSTRERLLQDFEGLGLSHSLLERDDTIVATQSVRSEIGTMSTIMDVNNGPLGLQDNGSDQGTVDTLDPIIQDGSSNKQCRMKDKQWLHELSHVWDGVVDEMVLLMIHSCQRFIETPEFDLWNDYYTRKQHKKHKNAPILQTLSENTSQ